MSVVMATSAGHVDRPNEDFVGAVPGAVVLLDGAGIPETEKVCHHGVAWYTLALGSTLLACLAREPMVHLSAALADSIEEVSGRHRDTCDLVDLSSPQATVAMARVGDDRVDYLVLADAFVVLDTHGAGSEVITDPREVDVRRQCTSILDGLEPGTPEYQSAETAARKALRARRNQVGGYWIAKDDPAAAAHAVTGSIPRDRLRACALLTNGASRLVDPYRVLDWPAVLDLLHTAGPDAAIRRVRQADADASSASAGDGLRPDDASIAYFTLGRRRHSSSRIA